MRLRTPILSKPACDGKRARDRSRQRKGVAAIEFAVLATLFVTLTVGVAEVSRGIRSKAVLIDAARTGCRMGILPGSSNATVTAGINSILTDNGLTATNATITIQVNCAVADVNTAKQNDKISVTVSYPVSKVFTKTLFIASAGNFTETTVMMRQG
jgi:Flp pilus assembly protein TadG